MSKDEKKVKAQQSASAEQPDSAEQKPCGDEACADTPAAEERVPSDAELKLTAKVEELQDKYVRLYAEYENHRKRSVKEKADAYSDAYADVINSFVPLMDNLERALEFEKDNEGFNMIMKQMLDIFSKLGVKAIDSDGAPFDPNLHNAIAHEDNPELGENVVAQTFQKGYTLNDKVIRHAMVKVAN